MLTNAESSHIHRLQGLRRSFPVRPSHSAGASGPRRGEHSPTRAGRLLTIVARRATGRTSGQDGARPVAGGSRMAQGDRQSGLPAAYVGVALIATVLAGFAGVNGTG